MAVYYKFMSAKEYNSIPMDTHFITVGHFKEKIFELKHLGSGTDFDLVVINAQTTEEYLDEGMLIPKNTSVLIRRVPGRPRKPIVTALVSEQEKPNVVNNCDDVQPVRGSVTRADPPAMKYADDLGWDEFGNDLYAIPETVPVLLSTSVQDAPPVSKADEDSKINALVDTPALDWQCQPSDGFGRGRGFGRGMGGRGFGRGGFEKKTPPHGYICYRCKVPGHFIQHCPTNGDPNFDIKRFKPPTGIPKSMLMATPDGSYALSSGAVAVLKPNEAAFEKEIEGMPSTRCSVSEFPPELHCPLCKQVMKDAVLTSKCCFTSFCDKCIRDYTISKSICVCAATSVLADDLLPNKTLRGTINRIMESNNSIAENSGSAFQVQDMELRNLQAKLPSPTQSASSKGPQVPALPPQGEEISKVAEAVEEKKYDNLPLEREKGRAQKVPHVSEATHDSRTVEEAASHRNAPLVDEDLQPKQSSGEAWKKKKKKTRMPPGVAEMQWRSGEDLAPANYMMHMGFADFNPYWNGIQPELDGAFMPPYGGPMPYMSYGLGPMDVAFGGVLLHDMLGGPGCMLPYGPPQRDIADLAMGYNARPSAPTMSRDESEARKAELKRRCEMERPGERKLPKDGEYGREGSRVDVSSRSKYKKSDYHQEDHQHRRGHRRDHRRRRRSKSHQNHHQQLKRKEYEPHEGRPLMTTAVTTKRISRGGGQQRWKSPAATRGVEEEEVIPVPDYDFTT